MYNTHIHTQTICIYIYVYIYVYIHINGKDMELKGIKMEAKYDVPSGNLA